MGVYTLVGTLCFSNPLVVEAKDYSETKQEWLKKAKGPKTSILSDEILSDMESGTPFDSCHVAPSYI